MSEMHRIRYTDGRTTIVVMVPWGNGTGWIPPGHIDFQMTVTHERRRFVYDGEVSPRIPTTAPPTQETAKVHQSADQTSTAGVEG